MLALFSALGVDLPDASTVIATRTIIVSLAARHRDHAAREHPARQAGDPRAADRGGPRGRDPAAPRASPRTRTRPASASRWPRSPRSPPGIFAGGAERRRGRVLLGGGVLGLFLGIALLAPRLVKPLARVVGWPARRAGGVAGELAGANAVRNPAAPHRPPPR